MSATESNFVLSRLKLLLSVASWPLRYRRPGARRLLEFIIVWRSGEFDPHWYLEQNSSVKIAGAHPLQHFILHGDANMANPNPNFDTKNYKRDRFVQWGGRNAFAHYLQNRHKANFNLPTGVERYPRLKIVVVAWDLGHNPAGRALLLAQALSRQHTVELWGAQFPRYGSKLWEPIRSLKNVTVRSWPGRDLPSYCEELLEQLATLQCDLVYVSKTRMPSMAFGILAKKLHRLPLIVDIDDYEPAFFQNKNPITVAQAIAETKDHKHLAPHDYEWTLASETLLNSAEQITVSNLALEQKFGGTVVPHLRDETQFVPDEKQRRKHRKKLGYRENDWVILFVGTPRMHKGLQRVVDALQILDRKDIHLLVIGTPADSAAKEFFSSNTSNNIKQLDNIGFNELPNYLNTGDLVCLMQDPELEVSRYQLPAKLIDALAMAIPVLVSDTPPLRPYIAAGLTTLTNNTQLPSAIAHVFDNYHGYKQRALKNREWFVKECSFHAFESKFETILDRAMQNRVALNSAGRELADYFAQSSASYSKIASKIKASAQYNIVYFWKQNDSGIYGRRQDMLVKYLLEDPRVANIVHFDLPITGSQLKALQRQAEEGKSDQSTLVYQQTIERLDGRRSQQGRLQEHTFVHDQLEDDIYSYAHDYAQYIERALESSLTVESSLKTLIVLSPRVPEFPYLLKRFRPHLIVSDIIDNHLKWKQKRWLRAELEEHYRGVLTCSDLALTNNFENKAEMSKWAEDIQLIPNAGEVFSRTQLASWDKPRELQALGDKKIIGYSGNLDSQRIDIELLDALVQLKPEYQFVFIGSTHQTKEVLILDEHPNVLFLGVKPYEEALHYIRYFDAAIVPHKDNELTRIMDPLKLYVYLSVGVPIVSTAVAVNKELASRIEFANSADTFSQRIESLLNQSSSCHEPESLLKDSDCWPQRVDTLLNLVDSKFSVD